MSPPQFNPRQLLDPKGYNADQRKVDAEPPLGTTNTEFTKTSQKRNQDDGEGNGMGNMIERVHNITDRQERPHKRKKTEKDDDADEKSKAAFGGGGGKGGEIGEYMKQKREEGQKESGPSTTVVDLTGGDLFRRSRRPTVLTLIMVSRRRCGCGRNR